MIALFLFTVFYVIVMFFYVVFQEFKHTLSKSDKRFDLVGAILLSLIWPIIFGYVMINIVGDKLGIE